MQAGQVQILLASERVMEPISEPDHRPKSSPVFPASHHQLQVQHTPRLHSPHSESHGQASATLTPELKQNQSAQNTYELPTLHNYNWVPGEKMEEKCIRGTMDVHQSNNNDDLMNEESLDCFPLDHKLKMNKHGSLPLLTAEHGDVSHTFLSSSPHSQALTQKDGMLKYPKTNPPVHFSSKQLEYNTTDSSISQCTTLSSTNLNWFPAPSSTHESHRSDLNLEFDSEIEGVRSPKIKPAVDMGNVKSMIAPIQRLNTRLGQESDDGNYKRAYSNSRPKKIDQEVLQLPLNINQQVVILQGKDQLDSAKWSSDSLYSPQVSDGPLDCKAEVSVPSYRAKTNTAARDLSCLSERPGSSSDPLTDEIYKQRCLKTVQSLFREACSNNNSVPMRQQLGYSTNPPVAVDQRIDDIREHYVPQSVCQSSEQQHLHGHGQQVQLIDNKSQDMELEFSELESLYQASLQASESRRYLPSRQSAEKATKQNSTKPVSAVNATRKHSSLPERGRSKTPTAEIERNAYRAAVPVSTKVHFNEVAPRENVENDSYSAENFRRIARSMSGTILANRENPVIIPHSIETMATPRKEVETRKRSVSSSSLTIARGPSPDPLVLASYPQHHPFLPQHLSSDPLQPNMSGDANRASGKNIEKFLAVFDRGEALNHENYQSVAVNYGTLPRSQKKLTLGQRPIRKDQINVENVIKQRLTQAVLPDKTRAEQLCKVSPHMTSLSRPLHQAKHELPDNFDTFPVHYRLGHGIGQNTLPKSNSMANTLDLQKYPCMRSTRSNVPGPVRLDVPPDEDWRKAVYVRPQHGDRTGLPIRTVTRTSGIGVHTKWPATKQTTSWPATRGRLCALCQLAHTDAGEVYCRNCSLYMARFKPQH